MFSSDGRLHIADFGLAKALAESGWTEPGKDLVGTARYASPEQAQGQRLTGASDVYSLGLIMVEGLSGTVPFSADTMLGTLTARVESDVPIPDVPEKLGEVLRAMTQRDPELRPTANQAGVAMLKAAEGMPRPSALALVGLPKAPKEQSRAARAKAVIGAGGEVDDDVDLVDDTMHEQPDMSADPDLTVHDVPDDATQVAGTPTIGRADEPVRRWPWLVISVAVIAAIGWWAYGEFAGSSLAATPVPNVVGMTQEEAIEALGDSWDVQEKFDRVNDVPAGQVIRTDPPADVVLEEGQSVSYWLSLGRPLVRVPDNDLIGRSREQAEETLKAIGLIVGEVDEINSEDVGRGNVISVEAAALELPEGDPVNLVVSLGPQTRVIPEAGAITDIAGYLANLELAGLGVERTDEYDNDVPLGQFVSIDPPPGTELDKGSTVVVVVSLGPVPVPVPATSGRPLGDVLTLLEDVGLLAGDLLGPEGETGNARCPVVGTDPPEGTELQPGNAVVIFLSDCGEG